jgi:hypothetical protein
LFGSLRQGKMRSSVECVPDPRRNKRKKGDSPIYHTNASCFQSLFVATPNQSTMENDAVLHAQQQWQWHH